MQEPKHINDIGLKNIYLRLASVKEATQRTRFVFLVMTVASSAIIFTLFNDRFSRDKTVAFNPNLSASAAPTPGSSETAPTNRPSPMSYPSPAASPTADSSQSAQVSNSPQPMNVYGRYQLVSEWYKNRIIQVGLLGIRVSVSDLSVMGSFTLVVISIWFFYCQRRENFALVTLLRDVHTQHRDNYDLRRMVLEGIKGGMVFSRVEQSDEPLAGLEQGPAASGGTSPTESRERKQKRSFTDIVLWFLSFLPFWAIVAILFRDFVAFRQQSPISGNDLSLWENMWIQAKWQGLAACWRTTTCWNAIYPIRLAIIFDMIALACAIYTWILCKKAGAFREASNKTLIESEERLKRDLEAVQS
jgi:hypothetical protein